jgi:glycosyltransferase involved in cell wall biosynthesis
MTDFLVSICLPTFNGASYLREAIDSVLSQTHKDFELVICDDQSQDTTFEILQDYANGDSRIRLLRNESTLGPIQNYNRCVELSAGTYVKLFAQDDVLEPNNLELCLNALRADSSLSFVTTAKDWIDGTGQPYSIENLFVQYFPSDQRITFSDTLESVLSTAQNWVGCPSTLMFPRHLFDKGFDNTFNQLMDLDFIFRMLKKGDGYYISKRLLKFRQHVRTQTHLNHGCPKANMEWLVLAARFAEDLKSTKNPFPVLCKYYIELFSQHVVIDRFAEYKYTNFLHLIGDKVDAETLSTAIFAGNILHNSRFTEVIDSQHREIQHLKEQLSVYKNHVETFNSALEIRRAFDQLEDLHHKYARVQKQIQTESISRSRAEDEILVKQETILELQSRLKSQNEIESEFAQKLEMLGNSFSWKVTEPLRKVSRYLTNTKRKQKFLSQRT